MDNITKLLNLEDEELIVTGVEIIESEKIIYVETKVKGHYCPVCNARMHSKGVKERRINHAVLQDHYKLVLVLKQRRWKCTNPSCSYDMAEGFNFVSKGKQNSNLTEILIAEAFKDFERTAASIGRQYNVSDHQAMDIFSNYVHMKRLSLPEILSIDEVYLDVDPYCKYVLILFDLTNGEPVDMLQSRRKDTTHPYFINIPKHERERVKYLISDMYNPYIEYTKIFFPNAVSVVDSFHVMQWIINKLDNYLRQLLKEYKVRDKQREIERLHLCREPDNVPLSNEVYLLQHYRWILLKNKRNITFEEKKFNKHFGMMLDTYDYEKMFFRLNPNLEILRELKEAYVDFNNNSLLNPKSARIELEELILEYETCGQPIFREFAKLLKSHEEPILNSFTYYERIKNNVSYISRLSNGPIESLNRKAKDIKRNSRGYSNFNHLRNRFLYSTRNNPGISFK